MRLIEQTSRFKKDFRRESRGQHKTNLSEILTQVLMLLTTDAALPDHYKDHALTGEWRLHRDCHLRPDLVLIYRLAGATTIQLVRLGSHSELGL